MKHFRKITDRKELKSRPVLQQISFTKDYIGVSDSHSLLTIPNKSGVIGAFNPKTLETLDGRNYPPLDKIIPDYDDPMVQTNITLEQIKVAKTLASVEVTDKFKLPREWVTFEEDMFLNPKNFTDMCNFLIDYLKENKYSIIRVEAGSPFKLLKVTPEKSTTDNGFIYILAPIRAIK
jgi:hypothetical protein